MLLGGSRVFGGLAGGAYAGWFGMGSGFAVCAIVCALAMIYFSLFVKKHLQTREEHTGVGASS
jgi:uncharacterized protein YcfJ